MEVIQLILNIACYILLIYSGFFALYFLIFSIAALFYKEPPADKPGSGANYAIFIPAYKEDSVIAEVAAEAAAHKSLNCTFDVYIIADSLQDNTLEKLASLPVNVIEVSFEKSTKSKALNKAMDTITKNYDYAVVLDADNIMQPGFIDNIDSALRRGFKAVQGHRTDKNLNTRFAILDAVSEGINNSIFRKGHRVIGLSAALIGSGFAVGYSYFKQLMSEIHAVGGFDKELEIKLIKDKTPIGFAQSAVVQDEKIQSAGDFAQQRRRWLSAQFIYFAKYFFVACRELLLNRNIDLFDKVIQMISPPRILLLGLSAILTILTALVALLTPMFAQPEPGFLSWFAVFATSLLAIMIATPRKFYKKETIIALSQLPKAFFLMLAALFKLKGANKKFIHTSHGSNSKQNNL